MKSQTNLETGKRIANLRASTGLTQKEIANEFGIPWRTYQAYELGAREVSARALAKFFEMKMWNPQWVLCGAGSPISGDEFREFREATQRVEDAIVLFGSELNKDKRFELIEIVVERSRSGSPMPDVEIKNCVRMGVDSNGN